MDKSGSVVSATTGDAYGATPKLTRYEAFASAAEVLLGQARQDFEVGSYDLALENAYRAALRTAGAFNAQSEVLRRRKRLPTSAWDKLALTGERGAEWAAIFSSYSALRGRVASGIELDPDRTVVGKLMADAEEFYQELVGGAAPAVA